MQLTSLEFLIYLSILLSGSALGDMCQNVLADLPYWLGRGTWPSIGHEQSESPNLDLLKGLVGGNYSKWVKPKHTKRHLSGKRLPFIVQTRMYLIRIQEANEAEQTLTTTLRFQLNWLDPALTWNPEKYDNTTSIIIPGNFLWMPDLQLANSINDLYDVLHDTNFAFRVDFDGNVWLHPTGTVTTRCQYDLMYFPYDFQRCLIIIESVVYEDHELKMIIRSNKSAIPLGMFAENEVWEVVRDNLRGYSTSYQSGEHTEFSRIHFEIVMKRRPAFFVMTIIVPVVLLAILTLFTYLVPIHYVDRTIQSVTVLLAVAVFEVMIADRVPKTSKPCMLTVFLAVVLCTSTATIFVTSLCLAIVDPGQFIDAPWGIPNLARGICNWCSNVFGYHRKRCMLPRITKKSRRCSNHNQYGEEAESQITATVASLRASTLNSDQGNQPNEMEFNNSSGGWHSHHFEIVPRHINEPERHLSPSKTAWYVAYAINWIAFFICLLFTVVVPIYAFAAMPMSAPRLVKLMDVESLSPKTSSYYGDDIL